MIVILAGILAIFCSFILSYITFKSITNKDFYIIICKDGMFLGIIQYSNKLINWSDINKIQILKINNINHIIIFIKNVDFYRNQESGIEKYFFESRVKKYGSPFVINTSALKTDVSDIFKSMIFNFKEFKKSDDADL